MNPPHPNSAAESTDARPPVSRRSRLRRWTYFLTSVLLSLAVGLALLEIGLRLFAPQPTGFYSFEDFNLPDRSLRPGAKGLLCGVPVEVNSYGERGAEYARPKPAGTRRVCVVGDSVVFGLGVNDHERYPVVLEHLLRQADSSAPIQVVPFAQVAYRLSGYRVRLLPKALEFDPDAIVLGFVLNDFELPPGPTSAPGLTSLHPSEPTGLVAALKHVTGRLRKHSHLVYLLRKRVQVLLATRLLSRDELVHYWEVECLYPDRPEFHARWQYTVEQLDAIHAACRQRGIPLIIVVTPLDVQMGPERLREYRRHLPDLPDSCLHDLPQRMLADYCRERGIEFLDLTPAFRAHPWPVFFEMLEGRADLYHPNAEGHRLIAEHGAARVRQVLEADRR